MDGAAHIEVRDLTMAFGHVVVQQHLNFEVRAGDVFIIMGDSGSGKSTLLKHMIGLYEPAAGEIFYHGRSFQRASEEQREAGPQETIVVHDDSCWRTGRKGAT